MERAGRASDQGVTRCVHHKRFSGPGSRGRTGPCTAGPVGATVRVRLRRAGPRGADRLQPDAGTGRRHQFRRCVLSGRASERDAPMGRRHHSRRPDHTRGRGDPCGHRGQPEQGATNAERAARGARVQTGRRDVPCRLAWSCRSRRECERLRGVHMARSTG